MITVYTGRWGWRLTHYKYFVDTIGRHSLISLFIRIIIGVSYPSTNKEIRTGSIGHCWVHTNDLPSYRIKRRGIVSRRTPGTSLSTHFYPLSKSLIRVRLNITDGEGGILLSGYIPNTLRGKPKQIRARPWKILDSIICVWAFFVPIFEQDTGFFFCILGTIRKDIGHGVWFREQAVRSQTDHN